MFKFKRNLFVTIFTIRGEEGNQDYQGLEFDRQSIKEVKGQYPGNQSAVQYSFYSDPQYLK